MFKLNTEFKKNYYENHNYKKSSKWIVLWEFDLEKCA